MRPRRWTAQTRSTCSAISRCPCCRTTALVVVSNIITYVQVYDQVMALTKGGPGDASYTATYYLFDKALGYYRFGYASATAVVLLVIIMLLSLLQFKLSGDD